MLPEGSAAEALAVRVAIGQEMVRGKILKGQRKVGEFYFESGKFTSLS